MAKILSGVGGGSALGGLLGTVGLGAIVASVGSVGALIYGIASLTDLVDGDISAWNLPGQFGHALGEGFARAWPGMAERIENAFTDNIAHSAGQEVGRQLEESDSVRDHLETGAVDVDDVPGLSQVADAGRWVGGLTDNRHGGRVTKSGAANVHRGELIVETGRKPTTGLKLLEDSTGVSDD